MISQHLHWLQIFADAVATAFGHGATELRRRADVTQASAAPTDCVCAGLLQCSRVWPPSTRPHTACHAMCSLQCAMHWRSLDRISVHWRATRHQLTLRRPAAFSQARDTIPIGHVLQVLKWLHLGAANLRLHAVLSTVLAQADAPTPVGTLSGHNVGIVVCIRCIRLIRFGLCRCLSSNAGSTCLAHSTRISRRVCRCERLLQTRRTARTSRMLEGFRLMQLQRLVRPIRRSSFPKQCGSCRMTVRCACSVTMRPTRYAQPPNETSTPVVATHCIPLGPSCCRAKLRSRVFSTRTHSECE